MIERTKKQLEPILLSVTAYFKKTVNLCAEFYNSTELTLSLEIQENGENSQERRDL